MLESFAWVLTSGLLQEFTTKPSVAQWNHFEKYSQRVRSLRYPGNMLGTRAFDLIAKTRTRLTVFPNLRTLNWDDGMSFDQCVIFMHNKITTMSATFDDEKELEIARTSLMDITRMPKITRFTLEMFYPMNTIEPIAAPLLSSMSNLEGLEILPFHFISGIAKPVSLLQHLRVVEFQWVHLDESTVEKSVSGDLNFEPGAFPRLEELSFCASFSDAIRFIVTPNGPKNLKKLSINSQDLESPMAYRALIAAIATTYESLTFLTLSCFCSWEIWCELPIEHQPTYEPFAIDILKPLFRLHGLLYLKVTYWGSLGLCDKDLEEIAIAFPSIETLDLNPLPMFPRTSDLTLSSILRFADHCPRLQELSFLIDTSHTTIPELQAAFQRAPRMKLKSLRLGIVGELREEETIAFLLSWVCPPECCVECEIELEGEEWDCDQSQRVSKLISLFHVAQTGKTLSL